MSKRVCFHVRELPSGKLYCSYETAYITSRTNVLGCLIDQYIEKRIPELRGDLYIHHWLQTESPLRGRIRSIDSKRAHFMRTEWNWQFVIRLS